MSSLLDTHTFLYILFDDPRLSARVREIVADPSRNVAVSVVSFWEIALKHRLNKLHLDGIAPRDMPALAREMSLTTLTLDADDAATFAELPVTRHKDPFDRMLIWQAMRRDLTMLSRDSAFAQYSSLGLTVIW